MKIVILPGLDGTGTLLAEVEEQLAHHYQVATLRYPSNLHSYEELQTVVEDGLPKDDFILVAESFSGPLAIMTASKKPVGLRGVVFVATFAKTPLKLPAFLTYLVGIVPIKSRLMTLLAQPILMGKWSRKDFTAKFRQAMNLVPASTIAGRLREVFKVDVVAKLRRLEIPIIYLLATSDRLVPSKMSHDFKLSNEAVFEIEGPHFLLQASAPACSKHILDFAACVG